MVPKSLGSPSYAGAMVWPWQRTKKKTPVFQVSPKGTKAAKSKVDLGALAPPVADYVASACVLQLSLASELAAVSKEAWSAKDADALMVASLTAMERYRAFRTLLADYEPDIAAALAAPREKLQSHLERFVTTRWYESVGTVYVVTGFTRDFWHRLAEGLPEGITPTIQEILSDKGDEDLLAGVLEGVLEADSRYMSRLSLWARRLVGDTMLMCRGTLLAGTSSGADTDITLEPVFTDVLALHVKRLDRLGLTA
jgi:hypothetical protein